MSLVKVSIVVEGFLWKEAVQRLRPFADRIRECLQAAKDAHPGSFAIGTYVPMVEMKSTSIRLPEELKDWLEIHGSKLQIIHELLLSCAAIHGPEELVPTFLQRLSEKAALQSC